MHNTYAIWHTDSYRKKGSPKMFLSLNFTKIDFKKCATCLRADKGVNRPFSSRLVFQKCLFTKNTFKILLLFFKIRLKTTTKYLKCHPSHSKNLKKQTPELWYEDYRSLLWKSVNEVDTNKCGSPPLTNSTKQYLKGLNCHKNWKIVLIFGKNLNWWFSAGNLLP